MKVWYDMIREWFVISFNGNIPLLWSVSYVTYPSIVWTICYPALHVQPGLENESQLAIRIEHECLLIMTGTETDSDFAVSIMYMYVYEEYPALMANAGMINSMTYFINITEAARNTLNKIEWNCKGSTEKIE